MEGLDNLPGKLHDVAYDNFLNNFPHNYFFVLNPSVRSGGSCSQSEDWSEDRDRASVAMQQGPYGHMIQKKSLGQSAPCSQLATDAIGQQG